jgi:hypothetical protein
MLVGGTTSTGDKAGQNFTEGPALQGERRHLPDIRASTNPSQGGPVQLFYAK